MESLGWLISSLRTLSLALVSNLRLNSATQGLSSVGAAAGVALRHPRILHFLLSALCPPALPFCRCTASTGSLQSTRPPPSPPAFSTLLAVLPATESRCCCSVYPFCRRGFAPGAAWSHIAHPIRLQ